jgi:hypothetical protein
MYVGGVTKGRDETMAAMKLLTDAAVDAKTTVKTAFDDIRANRKSDFVNNFRHRLANDLTLLERTWEGLKTVMVVEGALDPLMREMIHIAESNVNGRAYRTRSLTAALGRAA